MANNKFVAKFIDAIMVSIIIIIVACYVWMLLHEGAVWPQ